jgi:Tfp pilus assembly protein PilF
LQTELSALGIKVVIGACGIFGKPSLNIQQKLEEALKQLLPGHPKAEARPEPARAEPAPVVRPVVQRPAPPTGLLAMLHRRSPYSGFPLQSYPEDLQGEPANTPVMARLIEATRPELVIEMGSWKGGSAVQMANLLKEGGIGGKIVCVDTWLGGVDTWTDPARRAELRLRFGYPSVYEQFLANVLHRKVEDVIIPFPQTSVIAARWFSRNNLQAELVHLASHAGSDMETDLRACWPLVKPGGAIFGTGTAHDVSGFVREHALTVEEADGFWIICRPGGAKRNGETARASSTPAPRAQANGIPAAAHEALARAEAAYAKGELPTAREAMQEALKHAPDAVPLRDCLGNIEFLLGDFSSALATYRKAAEADRNNVDLQVRLATTALRCQDTRTFEQSVSRALELDDQNPAALRLLADANYGNGRFEDAGKFYQHLAEQSPRNKDLLILLGNCRYRLGKLPAARECFERVLVMDPQNAAARENLALVTR